jgi:membrane protease YdiL (CAAX protease family)
MTTYAHESAAARALDWPIVSFFVLAYAIAWGAFGLLALIARQSGLEGAQALLAMGEAFQFEGASLSVPYWLVYLLTRLADFAFSIAGVVMIAFTAGRSGLRELWQRLLRWRIGWIWYAVGLLPVLLFALSAVAAGGLTPADFSLRAISAAMFSLHAGFFVSLFLRGALGEELGLRGFALPWLQKRMIPFRASLIIGVFWGAWHLLVLIGRDILSIIAFSLLSIGLSILFTWLFNGSGGSLIPVLLFHAAQNWEVGFETIFPSLAGTDWELLSTLALLLIGLAAGVLVWRRRGD